MTGSPTPPPSGGQPPADAPIRLDALALAWLYPGLGHVWAGERLRGGLIMAAATLLILGGLLIGGLDVVDRRHDRLWFLAQAGNGPVVFVLDAVRTRASPGQDYDFRPGTEGRERYEDRDPEMIAHLERASIGQLNEVGTLWIALGGLMNLVIMLDFVNPGRVSARGGSGEPA